LYGSTGPLGSTGAQGLTGVEGSTGVQGNTGVQGSTGIQGPTGGPGVQGATGSVGVGAQGSQGLAGYYGSSTGVLGVNFDGNGNYLVPGIQVSVKVPHTVVLDSWEVVSSETGYFTSMIKSGSYTDWPTFTGMSGTTGPYLNGSSKESVSNLSGWVYTTLAEGNYLQLQTQNGTTGVKDVAVSLLYHRT